MKYKFEDIAFNSTEKKKPVESDKSHYIGLEHLDSQCLTVNRYGSDVAPIGEKLIMKKGDVLFGKRRAYQKKVAIAPFDGIFSAHGFVLRPKENVIDKNFFPFFISSDYFLDKASSISVGSLSPTINWSDLKVIEFELPDLDEQKRLAKILWKIEDIIKNIYQILEFHENKLKIKNCVLLDNTKLTNLGNVCDIVTGKLDVNSEDKNGKYPFFTCAKEPTFINKFAFEGQCTIVSGNGEFYCNYYDGKFNAYQRTYVITLKEKFKKVFNPLYINKIVNFNIESLRKLARGGVIKYIKIDNLREIKVPEIDLEKQLNLISKIQLIEQFDNKLEHIILKYKKIKNILIKEALNV